MSEVISRVIVDADACPKNAKKIIASMTEKLAGWEMLTVASINHNIEGNNRHIVVGNEPQAVDMIIVNMTRRGDVVVTQDWGLAAMVMGKGAGAISPTGIIYRPEKMDFLLEERHLKAKVRRGGGRTKGPAARTREDDERFARSLEKLMIEIGSPEEKEN